LTLQHVEGLKGHALLMSIQVPPLHYLKHRIELFIAQLIYHFDAGEGGLDLYKTQIGYKAWLNGIDKLNNQTFIT
jgi:hypothetical protein